MTKTITIITSEAALRNFKDQDQIIQGSALLETHRLSAVCRAWMQVDVRWDPPGAVPKEVQDGPVEELWGWLWETTTVPASSLANSAGLTIASTATLLLQLRKMKAIYPDGTVAKSMLRTMGIVMKQDLTKGMKQEKPKPKKEEETPRLLQ